MSWQGILLHDARGSIWVFEDQIQTVLPLPEKRCGITLDRRPIFSAESDILHDDCVSLPEVGGPHRVSGIIQEMKTLIPHEIAR